VDTVFPIIQPPQVAIVGAGAIAERPWVVAAQVVPRQVLGLSLGADHRVTDGRLGARFLARIAERLLDPGSL
jgi:pyruvate dehydrogenase E2 component (dihydrolipoamide acetyltransferase)